MYKERNILFFGSVVYTYVTKMHIAANLGVISEVKLESENHY